MSDQQTQSPRKRLRALLAIPESQRTDAQWDELNELEIATAPVNQLNAPAQTARRGPRVTKGGQKATPARATNAKGNGAPKGNMADRRSKPPRKGRRKPSVGNPAGNKSPGNTPV